VKDRHLISADELRAAGALDVPPAWRKSLEPDPKPKSAQRSLFADLDDAEPTDRASEPQADDGEAYEHAG
jgi:hypothetical protein